jgi:hypothetical protein
MLMCLSEGRRRKEMKGYSQVAITVLLLLVFGSIFAA